MTPQPRESTPDPADQAVFESIEEHLLGGPPVLTRAEVADRVGVPLELAEELWHSLGFPHVADDEVVFTEADVAALRHTITLVEAGILDEESQTAMVRTWGRSFARLAEWQTALLTGQARETSDPGDTLIDLVDQVLPVVDQLQSYIWRRHLMSAASRILLRPEGDVAVQAVGFVDIVGFTTQSKNLSRSELVELVETFEDFAASTVTDHGGQLVKTIGDEILYVVPDPVAAARISLSLVERGEQDESFPAVRAGAAYGEVLSRLGDVFGPTVNIASRLTSLARPGKVLIDRELARLLRPSAEAEEPEFRLRKQRRTSVKGYSRLEPWSLRRPKPSVKSTGKPTGKPAVTATADDGETAQSRNVIAEVFAEAMSEVRGQGGAVGRTETGRKNGPK